MPRVGDVHQVVRNPTAGLGRWFVGSDVETSVDRKGIGGDNLGAEDLGHLETEAALARSGGPEDQEEGRRGRELHKGQLRATGQDVAREFSILNS